MQTHLFFARVIILSVARDRNPTQASLTHTKKWGGRNVTGSHGWEGVESSSQNQRKSRRVLGVEPRFKTTRLALHTLRFFLFLLASSSPPSHTPIPHGGENSCQDTPTLHLSLFGLPQNRLWGKSLGALLYLRDDLKKHDEGVGKWERKERKPQMGIWSKQVMAGATRA